MFIKTTDDQLINLDAATKILWQARMDYDEEGHDLVAVIAGQREILISVVKSTETERSKLLDVLSIAIDEANEKKKFSISIQSVVDKLEALKDGPTEYLKQGPKGAIIG